MSNIKQIRSRLLKSKLISSLSSLKLAVFCFLVLSILIIAGTFYQIENGLYLAQERFFNSWFIGPFPSARLMMWVLFINLSFALAFRFNYSWKIFGLLLSHFGIMALLISGFLTLNFSTESFVKLYEGESSNIAESYYDWELKIKNKSTDQLEIYPISDIKEGFKLSEDLTVKTIYKNARLFETPFAGTILKNIGIDSNYENNIPGLVIDGMDSKYLEGETQPFIANHKYSLFLKRKSFDLPFTIQLLDVKRDLHPGTELAKAYASKISVNEDTLTRELTISMNKPYRNKTYTAFQASYGEDEDANEFTVLAIVENINHSLPYWATILASLGLFINFFQFLVLNLKRGED